MVICLYQYRQAYLNQVGINKGLEESLKASKREVGINRDVGN